MNKWENNYIKLKAFHLEKSLRLINEINELKQQLEEKEKEISNLKEQFDIFTLKNSFKYQNCMEKSKIDFAVDFTLHQLNNIENLIDMSLDYNPIKGEYKFDKKLFWSKANSLVKDIKKLKE